MTNSGEWFMNVRLLQISILILCSNFYCFGQKVLAAAEIVVDMTLEQVPHVQESQSCSSQANDWSELVRRATGLHVKSAYCTRTDPRSSDIKVQLLAPEGSFVVSTSIKMTDFGASGGRFETMDDCISALADEKQFFLNYTGLTPAAVYCYLDSSSSAIKYGIKVYAVATPQQMPKTLPVYELTRIYGEVLQEDVKKLNDSYQAFLEGSGDILRSFNLRQSGGIGELTSLVFTDKRSIHLAPLYVGQVDSLASCRNEERYIDSLRLTLGDTYVTSLCLDKKHFAQTGFSLAMFNGRLGGLYSIPTDEIFESYEQCVAAKALVIADHTNTEHKILAGICSQADLSAKVWNINLVF
jgi:hypothetical protein